MIGSASKANCVAIAISASVRSENACFQRSASIDAVPPLGSMSRLPSGWPATCSRLKPALSNRPVSISCIEDCRNRHGLGHAAGQHQRLITPASPW
jgi:hypothetical protein